MASWHRMLRWLRGMEGEYMADEERLKCGTTLAVSTTDLFGVYSIGVKEAVESLFKAG